MSRNTKTAFRPAIDGLEGRRLLAASPTATLARGVLTIRGTDAADVIDVSVQGPRGRTIAVEGIARTFRAAQVRRINVLGGDGDDTISVNVGARPRLVVRIDGGAGNDTIAGVPEVPPTPSSPISSVPPFSDPIARIPAASATSPSPGASVAETPPIQATPPAPVATPPTPVALPPAPGTPPAPPETSPIPSDVQKIIDLTNAERVAAGLAPLAVNAELMKAADIQSGNMARLNIMSHTLAGTDQPNLVDRALAAGYHYAWLGENIAYNYGDADAVVAGWMASPGHRANILNSHYTEIGVSIARNATGQPYYTQVFGSQA